MRSFSFFMILILACLSANLKAQCPEFEQFKQAYEAGNLEGALDYMRLVERCIKSKNKRPSSQDIIEFYKYKTFLYQDLDKASLAEENIQEFMKRILRKNPDYSPKENLPEKRKPDFYQLYNRHRYWPTHYIGFKGGANFTQINTSNVFSVDQINNQGAATYTGAYNFVAAAILELPILKRNTSFYFAPEISYSRTGYTFNDKLLDFANISLKESQDWIQLPLVLKYYFQRDEKVKKGKKNKGSTVKNKFQPFVELGFSLDYLLSAEAVISREDELPTGNSRQGIPEEVPVKSQRNNLNYSLVGGGGIKFKNFFRTGWDIFIEGRFNYGLPNLVKSETRGQNQSLLYNFGYIDSDFSINSITLSLGLLIPNYNPKPVGISGKPVNIDFSAPTPSKKKKR